MNSGGGGKKWLHFRNILKVEPTGFADELDVGCEEEKEVKSDFGLRNLKNGVVITEMRKPAEEAGFRERK